MKLRAFAFLLLCCAQLCFAAQTLEQGYDAFEQGDVATAVQIRLNRVTPPHRLIWGSCIAWARMCRPMIERQ
jgi:hypothetical protein